MTTPITRKKIFFFNPDADFQITKRGLKFCPNLRNGKFMLIHLNICTPVYMAGVSSEDRKIPN